MANPSGIINADEAHSTRRLTGLPTPTVSDEAATKGYADSVAVSGSTSDTAFASSWNGVTTIAPSKNAVYDWAHTFDTDDDGKVNVLDSVAGLVKTNASGVVSNAIAKTDYWDITDFTPSGTGHAHGLVPDPGASAATTKFLREDATWATPAGSGTVTTTGSPITGNLTKFSGGTSITNADLTGDVTTSGGVATTIASNAVTLSKMATMATDSILGRATTGTGNVETLTALPFAYTGDVTRPADSNATTIANSAVTYAKIQNVSANSKLLGSSATGSGAPPSEITLGTNLSMSGSTLNATGGGGGTIASTSDILKGDGSGNAVALGSATTGKILKSNGTVFVASTETYAAPGTTGNVLTSDGTNWTSATPGAGGGTTVKVSGSNFTTTSLTLVDITGLSFAASSGVTYEVECTLYGGPADTAGLRLSLNYSGTHTSTEGFMSMGPGSSTTATIIGGVLGSLPGGGFCTSSQTAATFKIWAVIHTTGTGNITVQVCKNTSGTATIIIGSRMTVTVL